MGMKSEGGARIVEKLIQQYGCLPATGDGPVISRFDRNAIAAGIECELSRASDYGFTKITLHMDLPDAALLAKFLRRPS